MEKQSFLYFNKSGVEPVTFPESSFLGVQADLTASNITIRFTAEDGNVGATSIVLGFTGTHKAACEALANVLSAGSGVHVIADNVENKYLSPFNAITTLTL